MITRQQGNLFTGAILAVIFGTVVGIALAYALTFTIVKVLFDLAGVN